MTRDTAAVVKRELADAVHRAEVNLQRARPRYLGRHIIAEFWGAEHVADPVMANQALIEASMASGANVIGSNVHHFGEGAGVTVVVLLMESHMSLHSWPEYDYAAIDIFTCGEADPHLAIDYLARQLRPKRVEIHEVLRGITPLEMSAQHGRRNDSIHELPVNMED